MTVVEIFLYNAYTPAQTGTVIISKILTFKEKDPKQE